VVDRDAALGHHRFEVAVADRVAAVPSHRPQHDLSAEMPSLEVVHAPAPPSSHGGQFTIPAEVADDASVGWPDEAEKRLEEPVAIVASPTNARWINALQKIPSVMDLVVSPLS